MEFVITLADGTKISRHDIETSIKRTGMNAEAGMRQVDFIIQRVLDQRAQDSQPKGVA